MNCHESAQNPPCQAKTVYLPTRQLQQAVKAGFLDEGFVEAYEEAKRARNGMGLASAETKEHLETKYNTLREEALKGLKRLREQGFADIVKRQSDKNTRQIISNQNGRFDNVDKDLSEVKDILKRMETKQDNLGNTVQMMRVGETSDITAPSQKKSAIRISQRISQNEVNYLNLIEEFQSQGFSLEDAKKKVREGAINDAATKADLKAKFKNKKDAEQEHDKAAKAAKTAKTKAEDVLSKAPNSTTDHQTALEKKTAAEDKKTEADTKASAAEVALAAVEESNKDAQKEAQKALKEAQTESKKRKTEFDKAVREFDRIDKIKKAVQKAKDAETAAIKAEQDAKDKLDKATEAYEEAKKATEPAELASEVDDKENKELDETNASEGEQELMVNALAAELDKTKAASEVDDKENKESHNKRKREMDETPEKVSKFPSLTRFGNLVKRQVQ